jgi:dTDP-4-dehydrorhamnose reductase
MRVAVTGHKGFIGSELVKRGYEPLECDITNLDEVNDAVHSVNPDMIIHCAAITDVEWCEIKENQKQVFAVNVGGVNKLLYDFNGIFVYLSSVHVFNGRKYWDYSEKHQPDPLSVYGFTKWAGEGVSRLAYGRSLVIRISKAFSRKSLSDTFNNLEYGEPQEFPTFIKRSFVYLPHLIDGISWVVEHFNELPMDLSLLNIAGTDTINYYHFWQMVAEEFGYDKKLIVSRSHKIDLAPRPFRGGLNTHLAKKLGVPLYSALEGIKEMKSGKD